MLRLALLALLLLPAASAAGQQLGNREKMAQTGMKFLSLAVDPRAAALADAVTAVETGSAALFFNPSTMAHQASFLTLSLTQMQWIAEIDYNQASVAFSPAGGRYGVFGLSFLSVDYGALQQTIRADNEQGFVDLDSFSPTAMSVGLGYARAVTDRFAVGGHVKYARQDLGDSVLDVDAVGGMSLAANRVGTLAYDFGVLYRTGFRSLNFAVTARNFAPEISFQEESFQLPLTMRLGVAMDVLDLVPAAGEAHALLLAVDAETPRDYAEQLKVGGEYRFMNTLALRAGYAFPAEEIGLSLGVGVQQALGGLGLGADYAYTDAGVFNQFGRVHRVALHLSL